MRLRARYGSNPRVRIVDEMSVLRGRSRIDVAVINGRLEGFEIKSEYDSLARLQGQARAYEQVFDRLTVICAERHLAAARHGLPEWWGLEVAQLEGAKVSIVRDRAPRANRQTDPRALAQLLWREEALVVLEGLGLDRGLRTKPRRVLWAALAEAMPARRLAAVVRDQLRAREDWLTAG
ncbi:MAG TPA: sce7726 family protein [Solirubrobacterales bacterium]|jgi:hypothetical protein|nr:sce7726 family protein [Solirubrobacterales bacterium]